MNEKKINFFYLMLVLLYLLVYSSPALSQIEWTKHGEAPVIGEGLPGSWNESGSGIPSVLYDGATYHMWYCGFDQNGYSGIGYASSADGITWTEYPENPVLTPGDENSWDGSVIESHCIIYDDSCFKMWYTGYNNNITDVHACIGYATSTDGINWKKYEGNPVITPIQTSWEGFAVGGPSVIKIGTNYHLWYVGSFDYNIGYAISQDGITWNKSEENPVLQSNDILWLCQVIYKDYQYEMWYYKGPLSNITINFAASSDGIKWIPSAANPVLEKGVPGTWDESGIGTCSVVFSDSTYRMWYLGKYSDEKRKIGFATSIPKSHDIKITSISNNLRVVPLYCKVNFTPTVNIMNIGFADEFDVAVNCVIDSASFIIYNDIQIVDTLQKSLVDSKEIMFVPCNFSTFDVSTYHINCYTSLSNDENFLNDTCRTNIKVTNTIDDFELDLSNWNVNYSGTATSGAFVYNGELSLNLKYENDSTSWASFKHKFDLSNLEKAYISYWSKTFLEPNKDFGFVEISTDGGNYWEQIGESYTGVSQNFENKTINLENYCGTGFDDVQIRFTILPNETIALPGWYIDDISIHSGEVAVHNSDKPQVTDKYTLFSNYPNPFNAETVLAYKLPKDNHVNIEIFNILGEKIITLVNKNQPAGLHRVRWNGKDRFGKNIPSGVYFYRMDSGDFISCKKMLLIK